MESVMSGKVRIGIVFGGRSGEHEVSLMSARSVMNVLSTEKYEVTAIGITPGGFWVTGIDALTALENKNWDHLSGAALLPEPRSGQFFTSQTQAQDIFLKATANLDVIFPVLHGTFGEDGCIQ
ncbi:D-alanine--D-alanine ligase A, partial [bacterium]|nr:D-alanine--D-alanine ligase A [bacterium]